RLADGLELAAAEGVSVVRPGHDAFAAKELALQARDPRPAHAVIVSHDRRTMKAEQGERLSPVAHRPLRVAKPHESRAGDQGFLTRLEQEQSLAKAVSRRNAVV